jgi:prepilin-type N-terminal cleavage/methylation domain-containing protein
MIVAPLPARQALSLLELTATLAILGLLAAVVVPRVWTSVDAARIAACETRQADIELQCYRWRRANGSGPALNLSDIGAAIDYFPQGLPACPVDGSAYVIDAQGTVVGHDHD